MSLYVTATGVKTFFVYRRVHGRPERIIIGRINEVTLEQAREKAQVINAQIADGKNPQAARRAIRQDITLGELWTLYLERHAKVHRSSWRHDENLHKLYLKNGATKSYRISRRKTSETCITQLAEKKEEYSGRVGKSKAGRKAGGGSTNNIAAMSGKRGEPDMAAKILRRGSS